jgi:hypothetical protein
MIDTDGEAAVLMIEMLSDYNPMRAERSPQSRPIALASI